MPDCPRAHYAVNVFFGAIKAIPHRMALRFSPEMREDILAYLKTFPDAAEFRHHVFEADESLKTGQFKLESRSPEGRLAVATENIKTALFEAAIWDDKPHNIVVKVSPKYDREYEAWMGSLPSSKPEGSFFPMDQAQQVPTQIDPTLENYDFRAEVDQ